MVRAYERISRRNAWWLGGLLSAAGCVPTTAAYLAIPVETENGTPRERGAVRVPIAELEKRMPDFDADTLSFYGAGRDPIPHRLVDDDADGSPEAALVVLPIAGDGSTRLIAVCPGPEAKGPLPDGNADPGIVLRFDRALR
jgi:hypothetical protein